jgi:hypothetical protein
MHGSSDGYRNEMMKYFKKCECFCTSFKSTEFL